MALVDRILIYEDHAIVIVFKYKDEYQQTLEYVLGYADELAVAGIRHAKSSMNKYFNWYLCGFFYFFYFIDFHFS